ncbi:MAG TPA: urease accessory UreF family protein [Chthoniobacteraceae bacterium]|jgi:urease accessory protein|nr:urease accessory UreF family protein [Chthoniobacteraceae bacterium]
MFTDWLPFVLQTSDPLFPTGAYAHSLGLEEFARLSEAAGGAAGENALRDFLHRQILPALALQELPYLRFAHAAAHAEELRALADIDREIHAWKIPAEARSASLRLGARRLDILLKTAPTPLLSAIAESGMPGHHITISGAQYAAVPLEAALMTYLYQTLSGYCVAALKLIRIGQEGCQRLLTGCLGAASQIVRDSLAIERPCAGCFNPLLEIAAMRHETAYERLFIS